MHLFQYVLMILLKTNGVKNKNKYVPWIKKKEKIL